MVLTSLDSEEVVGVPHRDHEDDRGHPGQRDGDLGVGYGSVA